MNCSGFEQGLARLLLEDDAVGVRAALIEELRRHGAGCPACRDSIPLIEVGALPPAQRDPFDEPTAEYWAGFDEDLRTRISAASSASAGSTDIPAARQSGGRRWVVAAALLAGALGIWVIARDVAGPPAAADVPIPFLVATADPLADEPLELPEALEQLLAEADPSWADPDAELVAGFESTPLSEAFDWDAAAALLAAEDGLGWIDDGVDEWGVPDGRRSLFPDASELDSGARAELLAWLETETGA